MKFKNKLFLIFDKFFSSYLEYKKSAYFDLKKNQGAEIIISSSAEIDVNSNFFVSSKSKLVIEDYVTISKNCIIQSEGFLKIDYNSFFGFSTIISCRNSVTIGANCLIAPFVSIRDHEHKYSDIEIAYNSQGFDDSSVCIGDNVWIGSYSVVMKGVNIGNNSIIGAHSLVNKDIPENSLAFGLPAKVIRKIGT